MSGGFKYYFEDFAPGHAIEIQGPTLTREEIVAFASKYDPQPFHVDEASARESMYHGIIASGWHTVALCMRMNCDAYLLDSASVGSSGIDQLRWLKPVRPGDRLALRMTVLETKASRSRPELGVVRHRWDVFNQNQELVMEMTGVGLYRRRTPGVPAGA
ncbi:MAG: MaoC family dehydratase [Burkholderiales bacterium]|nr:MaoC family dehydratase [Burkholderiales bacterium]